MTYWITLLMIIAGSIGIGLIIGYTRGYAHALDDMDDTGDYATRNYDVEHRRGGVIISRRIL